MKTTILFLSIFALLSITINAQTSVPDDAFETYLETHDANGNVVAVGDINSMGDGTDGNNLVTTSKINTVTNLYLSFLGIEDLTGIQDFIALEEFQFSGNNTNVTSLTLPALTNLKKIYFGSFPNLSMVDVSNLSNLEDATFQSLNILSTLDLSSNTNLIKLRVAGSASLSNLNITNLSSLEELSLTNSSVITALDFTTLTALKKVHIQDYSVLTSVDVSNLNTLEEFSTARLGAITSFDLSTLPSLDNLLITSNDLLTTINIKSGSTANINYVQLQRNPMLTCVEVDAGIPINGLSTWNAGNGAIFNEDCANPATYVPDDNFEAYLEANAMGNGIANDDKVFTNNINTIATLDVSGKSISDLTGIESFTALVELNASSNTLVSVDVSKNTVLENLFLNDNSITSIDVSKNTALKQFWVRQNNITILDVSKNVNLEWFVASRNSIQNLDLSLNTNLTTIEIHTNNLQTLNLKNISPNSTFFGNGNPDLTCIQVDNPSVWTTNHSSQIDNTASFSADCSYPTTNVPDAAFENYLETHDRDGNQVTLGDLTSMGNGIAGDNKVYNHRINTVTLLDPRENGIASLQGLEGFRDLKTFGYSGGLSSVTTVDVSQNLKLEKIFLGFTPTIANIIFGNLPNLTFIQMGFDNVTNIDLSGLPNLEDVRVFQSKITSFDVSNNLNLKFLMLQTPVKHLDVSKNVILESLTVTSQLESLNIANGNNNNLSLSISNNAGLTCITADAGIPTSGLSTWQTDAQHTFSSTLCANTLTYIPDDSFENYLETHDSNGDMVALGDASSMGNGIANDDYVFTTKINTVTVLDVSNIGLSSLLGLQDFRDLENFGAFGGNPNLTSINLSNNTKLKRITISLNSNLANVNFGILPDVTYVQLGYNNIASVDITGLPSLEEFKEFNGLYSALTVSANPNLKTLTLQGTPITTIDLSSNINLENININGSQLTKLDVSNNLELINLNVSNNQLENLDVSNNTKLESLNANTNQLISLNLKNGNNSILPGSFGPGISNFPFDIRNNSGLSCVEVSDVTYATTNWTAIDSQTTFSLDCSTTWTVMTNSATTSNLLSISGLDADNDGAITIAEAAAYTGTLDLSGSGITDVEGLQAFTGITTLDVSGNGITDLSPLTNSSFTIVAKSTGKTKTVTKTTSMALETLIVSDNNFEVIDLSSLNNLKEIKLNNNPSLITVNLKNGNNANITSFDASNAPNLTCIFVDDITATYLTTWTKDTNSTYVANETDCRSRVLAVNTFSIDSQISLYPNPIKDILQIRISSSLEIKKIEVFNAIGKKVYQTKLKEIQFSNYSKGFYFVKITTDKGTTTKKIIKN